MSDSQTPAALGDDDPVLDESDVSYGELTDDGPQVEGETA